jgi:hypothetical protein
LAYDYANQLTSPSPVQAIIVRRDAAQANADRIGQIASAIDREIEQIERRLQRHQHTVRERLADVVCSSEEYQALFVALDDAWSRLRAVRRAFDNIAVALKGCMPNRDLNKWQATQSLNHQAINLVTPAQPAQAWAESLQRLLENPDAELPGSGG